MIEEKLEKDSMVYESFEELFLKVVICIKNIG